MPESDGSCRPAPPDPSALTQTTVAAKSWMQRLADDESLAWALTDLDARGIVRLLTDEDFRRDTDGRPQFAYPRSEIIDMYRAGLIDDNGVPIPSVPAAP